MATGVLHNAYESASYGSSDLTNTTGDFDSTSTSIEIRGDLTIFSFLVEHVDITGNTWLTLCKTPSGARPKVLTNAIGVAGGTDIAQLLISTGGTVTVKVANSMTSTTIRGTFIWFNS